MLFIPFRELAPSSLRNPMPHGETDRGANIAERSSLSTGAAQCEMYRAIFDNGRRREDPYLVLPDHEGTCGHWAELTGPHISRV